MDLANTAENLGLLGDESRIRLCALLEDRELCVTDLVRLTGLSQSRVSTHLGRLRKAGLVRDRRRGTQSFYALATERLAPSLAALLREATTSSDPTLSADRRRLLELEAERRDGSGGDLADDLERFYSPGRTWQSLSAGLAALLQLGDVLDAGSGDGAVASVLAPYARSLTLVDLDPRRIARAKQRLCGFDHVTMWVADVHDLPFEAQRFDSVLLFHTLTYAEKPRRALEECARVLRTGGRLVLLCLDRHREADVPARHGERHPGFSAKELRASLQGVGLQKVSARVACREIRRPHLQVLLALGEKQPTVSSDSTGYRE